MNSFEKCILEDKAIPFNEAADFFLSVRQSVVYDQTKTAGLTDPPDEEGVLEGQFEVPVESVAALIQNAISKAMVLLNACLVYGSSLRGPASTSVACVIRHSDYGYRDLIEYLSKRASVLAGAVHVGDLEPVPPSTDAVTVAKSMIRGEQELIHALMEVAAVVGCNPMSSRLKSYAASAQDRMDDLWRALDPESKPPMLPKEPQKLLKHEQGETPEQEAAESPEFEAAEETAGVEPPEHEKGAAEQLRSDVIEAMRQGRMRGISQVMKDVTQSRAERGQRYGRAVGSVAGAAGGAALGKKLIGGRSGTIAGLAAGYLGGSGIGKEVGTSADIKRTRPRRSKTASVSASSVLRMRMKLAAMKLAQPPALGGVGEEASAPMSSPTDSQQLQPQNYLQAEMIGQQAQNAQEAEFYRTQAQQAQTAAQMAEQQMGALQAQLQQIQMQADQAGQQIQQATQSALSAQDEALKQTQVAANMRMGMQKLRAQMLEVASQDPSEVAAQELQAGGGVTQEEPLPQESGVPPVSSSTSKEMEEADRAQTDAAIQTEQAAQKAQQEGALAAPTAAPPGGGFPPGQEPGQAAAAPSGGMDISTLEPTPDMKVGSAATEQALNQLKQRLPWALAGAGLGALHHHSMKGSAPELRAKVEELQANQGGFFNAMRLAVRKQQLEEANMAEQFPHHSLALKAGKGALVGALAGPGITGNTQQALKHMKDL